MVKYLLKRGTFEVDKKQVNSVQDLIDDAFSDGSVFDVVAEFPDKAGGIKALSEKLNSIYPVSGRTGTLICGEAYFLCEEEHNEDGEFVEERGCDVAEWERE